MTKIPKHVTKAASEDSEIPQKVGELSQETEDPETKPYVISFAKYNEKMDGISDLNSNKAGKALKILKTIGAKNYAEPEWKVASVSNSGEYKKLFRGLGRDIELKEIYLQQTARIFYFRIEPKRIYYIIAITNNHIETDKVRR